MKKSWILIAAVIPLVLLGSILVWKASGDEPRRQGALGSDEAVTLSWRGEWNREAEYSAGNVVAHDGASYVAEGETLSAPEPGCKECGWTPMGAAAGAGAAEGAGAGAGAGAAAGAAGAAAGGGAPAGGAGAGAAASGAAGAAGGAAGAGAAGGAQAGAGAAGVPVALTEYELREETVSIEASSVGIAQVECSAGKKALGGGYIGSSSLDVVQSFPAAPDQWQVEARNTDPKNAVDLKVRAICAKAS